MSETIIGLQAQLQALISRAVSDIDQAESSYDLSAIRLKYTGKKGEISQFTKHMGQLSAQERPALGKAIAAFQADFQAVFDKKTELLSQVEMTAQLAKERVDVTLPGRNFTIGSRHILTQTREEIEDFFLGMGFQVIEGPEVELDSYNFERMNLPKDHPARDMQDTFYINSEVLLRTHTSPVQARTMEQHDFAKGPLKMISPGKVFRRDDDDATHSHQFQQVEGLVVDKGITLAHLAGTLLAFSKAMFGDDTEIRLRPSYFPFTEPSVEVDVTCFKCQGNGCNVCKHTGWIEILGAGLVHPRVLEMSGVDSKIYSGFAFGMGIERVAMLRYNVDDIRHFYQNDLRFLRQFRGGQDA